MATVFVTGATGTLGRAVVRSLLASGHHARALSRRERAAIPDGAQLVTGDLAHGVRLAEALAGAGAIIHCATDSHHAQATDVDGTRRLLAEAPATAPHLIYPSIVGIDDSPFGYYQAKRAVETLIEQGPLPWSILRATQFHDLVAQLIESCARSDDEIIIPAGLRFQSVDVEEAAARLVTLVATGPAGRIADLAGPEVLTFDEMAATYLRIRGRAAGIRRAALAGALYDVFRSGVNLTPTGARGVVTWDVWLRRRFSPGAPAQ
jgi:uncharacterized protein YbjT (DUF2867 family)